MRISKSFVKYILRRAIILYLTAVIAIYITIVIADAGGYIDKIIKSSIYVDIAMKIRGNPLYSQLPLSEVNKIIKAEYEKAIKRLGLDQPFLIRSIKVYLKNALTLNLGRAMYMTSDSGSRQVRIILLERLPQTILLFTTATVLIFLITLFCGLKLSRTYGSRIDKILTSLTPLSAIPGWFYGIILIMIFASWLHILPYGGLVDAPPPRNPILYALSVLKHMILPLAAWIISGFFIGTYSMRMLFLIYSTEDYVEVAYAKGLSAKDIERKYILKPALPPIITNFALSVIASWTGAIITETVFNWPGLGLALYQAIQYPDIPVIVGVTAIYAYLLMITVLILDIVYAIVDPRIRLEGG